MAQAPKRACLAPPIVPNNGDDEEFYMPRVVIYTDECSTASYPYTLNKKRPTASYAYALNKNTVPQTIPQIMSADEAGTSGWKVTLVTGGTGRDGVLHADDKGIPEIVDGGSGEHQTLKGLATASGAIDVMPRGEETTDCVGEAAKTPRMVEVEISGWVVLKEEEE